MTTITDEEIAQAALVRSSGFFKEEHYRRQRPDLPPNADAALDYVLNGARYSPGPLFDSAGYLRHYPDVAAAKVSPLIHYLKHGRAEGRGNVFAEPHTSAQRLSAPLQPERPKISGLVVVMEASEPSRVSQVCASLSNIPGRFKLLVAAPDRAAMKSVQDAAARARLNVQLECCLAGAEHSALFSRFAREVLAHDYVLQIRAGATANDAAAVDALIGSEPMVDTIIQIFNERADVGLFYPASADRPYWESQTATHDGGARALLHDLGITPDGAEHGANHPAEGMFWARVDALRPLLERGLADSPTLHDSSELLNRVLPTVARARSYSFVEYNWRSGAMLLNAGFLSFESYDAHNLEALAKIIDDVDMVSFDVFDTVLLRESTKAASVQRFAGQRLAELYPATASKFYELRVGAEHWARSDRSFEGDVGLTEIYQRFERTPIWTDEVIAQARALEEETDARSLTKRPGIEAILRCAKRAGKRIIGISDTYYATIQVRAFLDREGLAAFFDELYVSSDQKARKDRGDLWERVLSREQATPSRWLHVGDNEYSDIRAASRRGLKYLHLMRPATFLAYADLDFSADDTRWGTDLALGPVVNQLAGDPFRAGVPARPPVLRNAEEMGFCVFGPIVFAFLHWIVNHPALRSVSSLNFLSREGFLLHRIYQQIRARFPELALPEGRYLYASRRASLGASLAVDFASQRIIAEAKFEGRLADFLYQRIGFELIESMGVADQAIKLPGDDERVLSALETLRPHIVSHATRELDAYRGYLEQAGLSRPMPAVVDIGYSATIQTALQEIMGAPMAGFYLGAFDKARQVERRGGRAFGYLAENVAAGSSTEPAIAYSLLTEAFLIASHGQLACFERVGEAFVPKFKAPSHDAHAAAVLTDLHDGAMHYCVRLMEVYGASIWRSPIDKRAPQELFRALVEGLVDMPHELRLALQTEDNFSGAGTWLPLEEPRAPWKTGA